jgi:hypothetical protein
MQSFTFKQERSIPRCHCGDRFIPHRRPFNTSNFHYTNALSEASQEDDILKQVRGCLFWYTNPLVCPVDYQYFIITPSEQMKLVPNQGNHLYNTYTKETYQNCKNNPKLE